MAEHHKLMPPSASGRWLTCTASPALLADLPRSVSPFAAEGTLAHLIFEQMMSGTLTPSIDEVFEIDGFKVTYSQDMHDHLQDVVDYVAALNIDWDIELIEEKVELANGITGTVDYAVVCDETLDVMDLKYGQGLRVEAEGNTQMMIYALGILYGYGMLYDLETVTLRILQPRLRNYSAWSTTVEDLLEWELDHLRPASLAIALGEGKFAPSETACRWCPLTGRCDAQHTHMANMFEALPPAIMPSDYASLHFELVLPKVAEMRAYANAVDAAAFRYAMKGLDISGYKLVAGRSTRAWGAGAEDILVKTLQHPYIQKLKTVAVVEKELGRAAFAGTGLNELVVKPPGKPTLVIASDKRPAVDVSVHPLEFDNLEENENETDS